MTTGPYGRQWFPPSASSAFSPSLIKADSHCAKGELLQALNLYRAEAAYSHIAQRRLNIVKRQIRKLPLNKQQPMLLKMQIFWSLDVTGIESLLSLDLARTSW